MLKRFDAFIFDWDGTLNSMRTLMRLNEGVKRFVHMWNQDSELTTEDDTTSIGKSKISVDETRNGMLTTIFDVLLNFSRPRLHNDSIELIQFLRDKGKKVAIFSNGSGSRIHNELRILGIQDLFDIVVSAKDIHAVKPSPVGLRLVMKRLKIKPERVLYIGDMVDDIITADLAKTSSCGVASGFDSRHRLSSARPDYLFKDVEDMYRNISGKR